MLAVETWSLGRAALRPDRAIRQLWMKYVVFPTCPVVRLPDRRVPDDRAAWLAAMARTHQGTSYLAADDPQA